MGCQFLSDKGISQTEPSCLANDCAPGVFDNVMSCSLADDLPAVMSGVEGVIFLIQGSAIGHSSNATLDSQFGSPDHSTVSSSFGSARDVK